MQDVTRICGPLRNGCEWPPFTSPVEDRGADNELKTIRDGTKEILTEKVRLGAQSQKTASQDGRFAYSCPSNVDDERASSVGSEAALLPSTETSPRGTRSDRFWQALTREPDRENTTSQVYQITPAELRKFLCDKDVDLASQHTRVLRDDTRRFSVTLETDRRSKEYRCSPPTDLNTALRSIVSTINQANGTRTCHFLSLIPEDDAGKYAAFVVNKKGPAWVIVTHSENYDEIVGGIDRKQEADKGLVLRDSQSLWSSIRSVFT